MAGASSAAAGTAAWRRPLLPSPPFPPSSSPIQFLCPAANQNNSWLPSILWKGYKYLLWTFLLTFDIVMQNSLSWRFWLLLPSQMEQVACLLWLEARASLSQPCIQQFTYFLQKSCGFKKIFLFHTLRSAPPSLEAMAASAALQQQRPCPWPWNGQRLTTEYRPKGTRIRNWHTSRNHKKKP